MRLATEATDLPTREDLLDAFRTLAIEPSTVLTAAMLREILTHVVSDAPTVTPVIVERMIFWYEHRRAEELATMWAEGPRMAAAKAATAKVAALRRAKVGAIERLGRLLADVERERGGTSGGAAEGMVDTARHTTVAAVRAKFSGDAELAALLEAAGGAAEFDVFDVLRAAETTDSPTVALGELQARLAIGRIDCLFSAMDVNADGAISRDELSAKLRADGELQRLVHAAGCVARSRSP